MELPNCFRCRNPVSHRGECGCSDGCCRGIGIELEELMTNHKPAAHRNHPINAVLLPDESFRELASKVEYCEITWPQSYEMGEPIRIQNEPEPEELSLFESGVILGLCLCGLVLIVAISAALNAMGVW